MFSKSNSVWSDCIGNLINEHCQASAVFGDESRGKWTWRSGLIVIVVVFKWFPYTANNQLSKSIVNIQYIHMRFTNILLLQPRTGPYPLSLVPNPCPPIYHSTHSMPHYLNQHSYTILCIYASDIGPIIHLTACVSAYICYGCVHTSYTHTHIHPHTHTHTHTHTHIRTFTKTHTN